MQLAQKAKENGNTANYHHFIIMTENPKHIQKLYDELLDQEKGVALSIWFDGDERIEYFENGRREKLIALGKKYVGEPHHFTEGVELLVLAKDKKELQVLYDDLLESGADSSQISRVQRALIEVP